MTKCSFKNCKNHTSRTLKTDGVSYFRFPRDPIRREAWTSIVARQKCDEYFIPNERSVICSDHFLESDKYVTAKDLKRLHKTAVPRLFRTEAQLKKCWDNLKTRRKSVLAQEKRERMKTGGGSFDPQPSTSTAMTSQVLDEALLETTDVKLQFVIDSDSVPNPLETQENRDIMMSTVIDPSITLNEPSTQEEQVRERDTPPRRSGSRLTDYGGSTSQPQLRQTNIRSRVIQDEFTIRQNMYKRKEEREEDLHKLYVAEQQWKDTKTPQTWTDLQHNAESSNNSEFENCICVECYEPVHGEQFMCVQCADHKLCVRCAIERGAHREHFLLRVPLGQPLEKVEMILQKLRLMLENDSDESEHEDEVKMEVKDEVETYDEDPLTFYVKPEQDELEQEQLELEKLEREVLADKYNNMLKESKDISDVNNAPHGSELQPELVGGTTASNTVFNQHIVVKQEDEVSLHTSTIIPSISPSFSPIIPKVPTGTNTSKQVQTPILVARPAYLMELNKLMATIPGAATERPVDRELQTVPVSVVGRASARKHNLVTENLQIRVAKDHYDESEDIQ